MAGFRSPLFLLGLSGGEPQAGFRTPIPVWPAGGTTAVTQAGFRTALPFFNAGAFEPIEVEPPKKGGGGPELYNRNRRWILREDEEILAIIMAHTLH